MLISFTHQNRKYQANLAEPLDLSIPLAEGDNNPACYWADPVTFETIRSGDFVGSVAAGGPVNYQKISLTPHGNGTHTECYGHITADERAYVGKTLRQSHFVCQLISLEPTLKEHDMVIGFEQFQEKWSETGANALVIRTLPNDTTKLTRKYSGSNPPYLDARILAFLATHEVDHLILDLPSVDKEVDGGKLAGHRAFWRVPDRIRKYATITELAYIPNEIKDGMYLLNIQTINLECDACPSRPVLYKMTSI